MADLITSQVAWRVGRCERIHISRIFEASHVGAALCRRGLKHRHLIPAFEGAARVCEAIHARCCNRPGWYDVSQSEMEAIEHAMDLLQELYKITLASEVLKVLVAQKARLGLKKTANQA
ncbi:hypothetical protein ACFS07_35560 [Undibacterium arcticum]